MKYSILCILSLVFLRAAAIFDENWQCSEIFRQQLSILGIQPASWHVKDVAPLLIKLYFQEDATYYQQGGQSFNPQPVENLKKYLELEYSMHEDKFPSPVEPDLVDVVFQGGVRTTIKKRFSTLVALKNQGFKIKKIHVTTLGKENANEAKNFFNKAKYSTDYEFSNFNLIIPTQSINTFAECLDILQEQKTLSDKYILVTSPLFEEKSTQMAKKKLTDYIFVGVAAKAIKDWMEDLTLSGFLKSSNGDKDEATRRWAESNLQFKAREAQQVLTLYEKSIQKKLLSSLKQKLS